MKNTMTPTNNVERFKNSEAARRAAEAGMDVDALVAELAESVPSWRPTPPDWADDPETFTAEYSEDGEILCTNVHHVGYVDVAGVPDIHVEVVQAVRTTPGDVTKGPFTVESDPVGVQLLVGNDAAVLSPDEAIELAGFLFHAAGFALYTKTLDELRDESASAPASSVEWRKHYATREEALLREVLAAIGGWGVDSADVDVDALADAVLLRDEGGWYCGASAAEFWGAVARCATATGAEA